MITLAEHGRFTTEPGQIFTEPRPEPREECWWKPRSPICTDFAKP